MAKMKFTQEPWSTGYDNEGNGSFSEWHNIETSERNIAIVGLNSETKDEDTANARLISKAPELCDFLIRYLNNVHYIYYPGYESMGTIVEKANTPEQLKDMAIELLSEIEKGE